MAKQLTLEAAEFAVENAVGEHWSTTVRFHFDVLVRRGLPFTADDLRQQLPEGTYVARPNLIGELFKHARQVGRIREGRSVRSDRPDARGRRVIVWHPVMQR